MASTNQDSHRNSNARRTHQRRLMLLIAAAFALIAWGPRTVKMLEKGWYSSRVALARQREVDEARERLEALQREVAYARTSEGKDVEAKRRFGVGPRDEFWITVDAEKAPGERPQPQSVAERVDAWLADAGNRFMDRVREFGAVVSYAVGLSDVDECVAVPVIEDADSAESVDETEGTAASAAETAASDGEAAEDGARE